MTTNRKVFLLGIDGATFSILDPLLAQGKLPNLLRMQQFGAWGKLQSTRQPITPAAWTSMFTGLTPGKHGIYDFQRRKPDSYELELVNGRMRDGQAVWSWLSTQGQQVGVLNVPITYPPERVNGFFVSGMDAPRNAQVSITHPAELFSDIIETVGKYQIDLDWVCDDEKIYLDRIVNLLENRIDTLHFLLNRYPDLDFLAAVFICTDRLYHVFWKYLDPASPDYNHPQAEYFRQEIEAFHIKIDQVVGELLDKMLQEKGILMIVSDHGFGPLQKQVNVNQFLIDTGYLKLKSNADNKAIRFSEAVDWAKTKAYSFGYFGNINLNLYGREPNGTVEPGREARDLKTLIGQDLLHLHDPETSEAIVDHVYSKEDLYTGIHYEDAPDLLVVIKDYAYMTQDKLELNQSSSVQPPVITDHCRPVSETLPHTGNHRMDGVIMMIGEGIKPGTKIEGANIVDVAPTISYLLDVPMPPHLDGTVLTEAIEDEYLKEIPVNQRHFSQNGQVTKKTLRTLLTEKDMQIALLNSEIKRFENSLGQLEQTLTDKEAKIQTLSNLIERFQQGYFIRFMALLHRVKLKFSNLIGISKKS